MEVPLYMYFIYLHEHQDWSTDIRYTPDFHGQTYTSIQGKNWDTFQHKDLNFLEKNQLKRRAKSRVPEEVQIEHPPNRIYNQFNNNLLSFHQWRGLEVKVGSAARRLQVDVCFSLQHDYVAQVKKQPEKNSAKTSEPTAAQPAWFELPPVSAAPLHPAAAKVSCGEQKLAAAWSWQWQHSHQSAFPPQ